MMFKTSAARTRRSISRPDLHGSVASGEAKSSQLKRRPRVWGLLVAGE
jgi:hypothetical protein